MLDQFEHGRNGAFGVVADGPQGGQRRGAEVVVFQLVRHGRHGTAGIGTDRRQARQRQAAHGDVGVLEGVAQRRHGLLGVRPHLGEGTEDIHAQQWIG